MNPLLRIPSPRRAFPLATALALAAPLPACAGPAEGPSRVEAENEVAARTLMTLWGSGDVASLTGLFHPDAVYDDYPNQTQYRGIEEIAGYVNHVHDWATAVDMAVLAVHPSERGATVEWVFSAIQDRPIGSRVPVATGREVVLNGVTVLELEGGRIRRAADYIDALALVLQLGGEAHMPGGSVIKLDLPDPPAEDGADPGEGA